MIALRFALGIIILVGLIGPSGAQAASSEPPLPQETLDQLVAPIALYPDALIIQILQCAMDPGQVQQLGTWLNENQDLQGSAAQKAAAEQGFEASFVAIVLFPQVVHMMADVPDWTQNLGDAFATDRDGVLAAIQRLRKQAQTVGNLQTTEQQTVETVTTEGGDQVIVIQPANPQVVYVPQYDSQVVYAQPAPPRQQRGSDAGGGADRIYRRRHYRGRGGQ